MTRRKEAGRWIGIEHYPVFLSTGILLNLAPGPDTFYILGAAYLVWLRARPRFGAWLDRISGFVFVGLGIRLALQQRA